MYMIGKTGTGKSTLLQSLVRSDLRNGEGLALFDPHGDLVEGIVEAIPEERRPVLLYLNLPDPALELRFNPLAGVAPEQQPLAAAGLIEAFKKIWSDAWGPRLEHVLRNVFFALLEVPGATLADIPRLFNDDAFRQRVVEGLGNDQVRAFWRSEFARYPQSLRAQVLAPVQNKVGAFLADPRVHRVLATPGTTLDLRRVMDERQILLVNLAKGVIGEGPAALVGNLLVASLGLAGLSRSDTPAAIRQDFYIYLDEFHTFATLSLTTMLSELRKYRVSLVLAHQYLSQIETEIRDAVLGNVGTLMSFRVGAQDATVLAREFLPKFSAQDLIALPNYHLYLKLMIDGVVSQPFSAVTCQQPLS